MSCLTRPSVSHAPTPPSCHHYAHARSFFLSRIWFCFFCVLIFCPISFLTIAPPRKDGSWVVFLVTRYCSRRGSPIFIRALFLKLGFLFLMRVELERVDVFLLMECTVCFQNLTFWFGASSIVWTMGKHQYFLGKIALLVPQFISSFGFGPPVI